MLLSHVVVFSNFRLHLVFQLSKYNYNSNNSNIDNNNNIKTLIQPLYDKFYINKVSWVIDEDHQNSCLFTNKCHFSSPLCVLIGVLAKFDE